MHPSARRRFALLGPLSGPTAAAAGLALAALLVAACGGGAGYMGSDLWMQDDEGLPAVPDLSTGVAPEDLASAPDLSGPDDGDVPPDFAGAPALGCNGLLSCVVACKGKVACSRACEAQASKEARRLYLALVACVDVQCPTTKGDGGVDPCAKVASMECITCRNAAIAVGAPCQADYSACAASLP